jgi:hypothetical protein
LFEAVVISQAANIHFMLVSCLESTAKYQELSFFGSSVSITCVFGITHTATNIQLIERFHQDFKLIPVTQFSSPTISCTSSVVNISIFSCFLASSNQQTSHLKFLLLCIT